MPIKPLKGTLLYAGSQMWIQIYIKVTVHKKRISVPQCL